MAKPTPPTPPQPGNSGNGQPGEESSDQPGDAPGQPGDQPGDENAPGQPDGFEPAGEIWDAVGDDGEALSEADKQQAEETLKRDVIVAAAAEKAAGSGSITIDEGILDSAKAAHVDWVEALADFLDRSFGQEPTLAKPSRRHLWRGDYFPSLKGIGGGDLVIAIDTSLSVSQQEAERFAAEIDGIRETIKPDRTCVIYCDTRIQRGADGQLYDDFDSYDDIEVRKIKGIGTRFDPPFHLVVQEELKPSAFIYFTDGYCYVGSDLAEIVDYPVLWATPGVAPDFHGEEFGEVLEVEV